MSCHPVTRGACSPQTLDVQKLAATNLPATLLSSTPVVNKGLNGSINYASNGNNGSKDLAGDSDSASSEGQELSSPLQGLLMKLGLASLLSSIAQQNAQLSKISVNNDSGSDSTLMDDALSETTLPDDGSMGMVGKEKMVDGQSALLQQDSADAANRATMSEKDTSVRPTDENMKEGRPPGDKRSADDIINDNDVLKNLGGQKDLHLADMKKRVGDWTDNNKDPESRADAAYNMARFLNCVKDLKGSDDSDRGDVKTDGKINGVTKDGDVRDGTEAAVLKNCARDGIDEAFPKDEKLWKTSDTHVRPDGTNKDNFQWAMGEFGKILDKIPVIGSIWSGPFKAMGEARNAGEVFSKGIGAYFTETLPEALSMVATGPAGLAAKVGIKTITDTVDIVKDSKNDKEPPPFS